MDEEQLCLRLHKRLRIGSPTAARQLANGHYSQANSFLQQLHAEHLARRQQTPRPADPSPDATMTMPAQAWTAGGNAADTDFAAMTHFVLSDVVQCSHAAQGRCLQCTGRLVQNVPLQVYTDWCAACSSPASSSIAPPPRPCATSVRELTFPATAALIACLSPEPGERLLHLSSGVARVAVAWALLVPRGLACGIESCAALHEAAAAAVERLDTEVQNRVLLYNSNLLDSQNDWHQASTILVSGEALEDSHVARVTAGLGRTQPGTRIASIGRPLDTPHGLQLVRQVLYRTVGSGNAPVFIYRKPGI
ncbi:unnamed protein product [Symbiodinium natans]|uniref:Uncharacterized protein n=1 Tax=Symbiodinium natans TaxID=878477 RepID=A0A812GSD3_9DINO|nr:unnamed protein product [Symbiodinium natans]